MIFIRIIVGSVKYNIRDERSIGKMTIDKNKIIQKAGMYDVLCEGCQHGQVCGHGSDMKDAIGKLSNLKMNYERQPFDFEIHCKHYMPILKKEDGE